MKRLFICEKPNFGRALSEVLAKVAGTSPQKGNGHIWVGDDVVSWAAGHLFELANATAYGEQYKSWDIKDLPIIPLTWRWVPRDRARDQIKVLKGLLSDARKAGATVVSAGDAAREGQLIVDLILQELQWSGRTLRFWAKAETDDGIREALQTLKPNSEYQGLLDAALTRSKADWFYGINLTRAYTGAARSAGADMTVTVGRVQTPTLALVVKRYREIQNFVPVDHFMPILVAHHANGRFTVEWIVPEEAPGIDAEGRVLERALAEAVLKRVAGQAGQVLRYEVKEMSDPPPLPFSLSELISRAKGHTAKEVLDAAQHLYERPQSALSYPRTGCRHLPESLHGEAPAILQGLASKYPEYRELVAGADWSLRSGAWNDKKVAESDHHALTLTGTFDTIGALSGTRKAVFDLVAKSLIMQFYPPHRYKAVSVEVKVKDDRFRATGKTVVVNGWRAVQGGDDKDKAEALPEMRQGDPVRMDEGKVEARKTRPPAYYTDQTLVRAMSNIHHEVTDPDVRKRLRDSDGIGTEATRPSIIEGLLTVRNNVSLMRRKDKTKLLPTDAGCAVIDMLPPEVYDPGTTALWEGALERIEKKALEPKQFMDALTKVVTGRIEKVRTEGVKLTGIKVRDRLPGEGEPCPTCGKGSMTARQVRRTGPSQGKWYLGCSAYPDCSHVIWPDREEIEPLPGHGNPCPKCSEGQLVTRMARQGRNAGNRFLACSRRECGHIENTAAPEPRASEAANAPPKPPQAGSGGRLAGLMRRRKGQEN